VHQLHGERGCIPRGLYDHFALPSCWVEEHTITIATSVLTTVFSGEPGSAFDLWPPCVIGQAIYIFILSFVVVLSFFSSPNLSGPRLDVCHTSTHGVALV